MRRRGRDQADKEPICLSFWAKVDTSQEILHFTQEKRVHSAFLLLGEFFFLQKPLPKECKRLSSLNALNFPHCNFPPFCTKKAWTKYFERAFKEERIAFPLLASTDAKAYPRKVESSATFPKQYNQASGTEAELYYTTYTFVGKGGKGVQREIVTIPSLFPLF